MTGTAPLASAETSEQIAHLRATFAALAIQTVARYTELVGSSMAAPLQRDVTEVARTNAWNVQLNLSDVSDTQAFQTAEAAARAYRVLARTIINDMSLVVGPRLAHSIVRDVTQKLAPDQAHLIQTYHLVPEAALGGRAG